MTRVLGWVRDVSGTAIFFLQEGILSLHGNWGIGVLAVVLAFSLWVFVTDRENPDVTGRVPGSIPIEVVNLPENQAVASVSPESATVQVRASENVFDDLGADDFRATVDLSSVETAQATVGVAIETSVSRVEVVEITPPQVVVQLEPVTSKAVPIEAQIVGTPPRGFDVGEITIQPEEAVVSGPESLVDLVVAVEANVDLTGSQANFEQNLLIEARGGGGKIEGVTVQPNTALVAVELVQLEFSQFFVVVPDVTGSPAPGYQATAIAVAPQFVTVTGSADVFRGLDPTVGVSTEPVIIDGASADVVRPVALILPEGASVTQPTVTVRITIEPLGSSP